MPIEWRFASSAAPTRENVAGNEKQLHERKKNIPTMTAAPIWNKQDERVADDRDQIENNERAAMSPKIHNHSAGIGVDRAEQSAQRIIKSRSQKPSRRLLADTSAQNASKVLRQRQ